jgi:predicted DNA-binding transcriptional regulator AlpA
MPHTLMNMRQLMEALDIKSRQTIYARLRSDQSFPRPRRMNMRFLRWHRQDVEAYIADLPAATFEGARGVSDMV